MDRKSFAAPVKMDTSQISESDDSDVSSINGEDLGEDDPFRDLMPKKDSKSSPARGSDVKSRSVQSPIKFDVQPSSKHLRAICRSENIPFLPKVHRPRRNQKEIRVEDHVDYCSAKSFISVDLYRRVCKCIEDAYRDNEEILDQNCLNVFISYGFRSLTGLEYGINSIINRSDSKMEVGDGDVSMESRKSNKKPPCCKFCGREICICSEFSQIFLRTTEAMVSKDKYSKGMIDAGLYPILKEKITAQVQAECSGKYFANHISNLLIWLEGLTPWLKIISYNEDSSFHNELKLFMLEIIGQIIIDELFPIIVEFPDSRLILDDLKYCMRRVSLRNYLVTSLTAALEKRLLNAGVNTNVLLEAYLSTVKTLKYIDPSGILVQLVTPQTREYLKNRDDTVRVILLSLTEDSGDLADELAKASVTVQNEWSNWDSWVPDPIDVPKDTQNLRKSDIIQTILTIYGSKSLFMDEYRALLADRLLKMPKPKSVSEEIKWVELLKLRFEESDLQTCEVMLKDMADSHRLNTRLYEDESGALAKEDIAVTGLIISEQFWPALKQESLNVPKEVEASLEKYTKAFQAIKGNRSLEWQKHIGHVDLELEFNGSLYQFSVSPPIATILWHFQEKERWKLTELATVTGLSENLIKTRIAFWIAKRVLREIDDDSYELNDKFVSEGIPAPDALPFLKEDEIESHMTSASAQREAELQVFWKYIQGILANLDGLPISRIFTMLKLFATVECSQDDLEKFLDDKVGEGTLLYINGNYKVVK